jgi:hypothetical protein
MNLNGTVLTLCLAVSSLRPSASFAQQVAADSCDLPVVVADFNNELVRDLAPIDFSVRLGDVPMTVNNATVDGGPKRVAIILDASRNIPEDEWKLETEMAARFAEHARPKDLFAFLVIGAEGTAASLLSSGEVADRLRELAGSRPASSEGSEKIYDAVLAAVNRLDPPQFGDAIFLFGHHEDFGSTADPDHVLDAVLRSRLRFYGMSFADRLAKLPPGFDLNKPLPKGFGRSKLEVLSAETGYFFSFHNVRSLNYPGQMPLFKTFLGVLYAWIAEPYRLRVSGLDIKHKTGLEINVKSLDTRKIHREGIHYPRSLYPCAATPEKAP